MSRRSRVTITGGTDPFPPGLPMAVQVEFTSRCNLRCRMCPLTTGTSSSSADPGPMTDVVFEELLDIARRCGRVVLAGYGEPLTNPQCLPMLRALNAEGIDISMATNGLALTPEIARALVALEHLTHINLSIDSPDPTVYRDVRGGNVERALQGLRNLMAVIDNRDRVLVASVALYANLHTLVGFPAILAELGVRHFSLQAVHDYNEYSREQRLVDHGELAPVFQQIEAACITFGIDLELSVPDRSRADFDDVARGRDRYYGHEEWDERMTRQCHVPWDIPFVDKDGRVFACCFAAAADERQLGRLGPQSFDEVWSGPEFRRFRRDIVNGSTTPGVCRRCTLVPLGTHPYKTWAGVVLAGRVVTSPAGATVSVSVRNLGERTWTAADEVRVGTASPRDSRSPLAHPAWLSPNRPATFVEASVPPGALATFEFQVGRSGRARAGAFEIVADRACWLPNTGFGVMVAGSVSSQIPRARRAWTRLCDAR